MGKRHKDEINQEYAQLCTQYGDISQKLKALESQEKDALTALELKIHNVKVEVAQIRVSLTKEREKIEERWDELKVEMADSEEPQSLNP